MGRLFRLLIFTALILAVGSGIDAAPAMEWGKMIGAVGEAPAHYRKDDNFPVDFIVILKISGDSLYKVDTYTATLSVDPSFTIPPGEVAAKEISNLYPGGEKYIYWAVTPPALGGALFDYANALQISATYVMNGSVYSNGTISKDVWVTESFSTPQFSVTNNIVGDLLPGGYIEVVQTVEITGGNNNQLAWGNFLDSYELLELIDIHSDVPGHDDPQTFSPFPAPLGTYNITYKFYINPHAASSLVSFNNYFLGDTGSQWRTQDSEILGTGIPALEIYPQGFQGRIVECNSGIGIPNIPVSVYTMADVLYDSRPSTLSDGNYFFGVKDTGTYKLYFNDPSHAGYLPEYTSYLDDNGGAGHSITTDLIIEVNSCLYHYNGGTVYFDAEIYRNGDQIIITVEDLDLNVDGAVSESVLVTLTSDSGDSESVMLIEVAPDSGIFRNSITATVSAVVTENGHLNCSNGDNILVDYYDQKDYTGSALHVYDTAVFYDTTTSHLNYFDIDGQMVLSYAVGNTVYLKLIDPDQNINNTIAETLSLTLINDSGDDTENIVLVEENTDSSTFTFSLLSAPVPYSAGNMIVNANPGDILHGYYTDPNDPSDTTTSQVYFISPSSSVIQITDGIIPRVKLIADEDQVFLKVNDLDRNRDDSSLDTLNVQCNMSISGDAEIFQLTETGISSGIFTNILPITLTNAAAVSSDLILQSSAADTLTALYVDLHDQSDTSSITALIGVAVPSGIVFLDFLSADATFYYTGQNVFISLSDADENLDPNSVEDLEITLVTSVSADSETILLTETGISTGVFENIAGIPIVNSTAVQGNGIIESDPTETLTVNYIDPSDASDTCLDNAEIYEDQWVSDLDFISDTGALIEGVRIGDMDAFLRLQDIDLNLSPGVMDTFAISVYCTVTGDTETVDLTETSADSGVFESPALNLTLIPGAPFDGALTVISGEFIASTYIDPGDATDTSHDELFTVAPSFASLALYDKWGELSDAFDVGDTVTIEINDPDNGLSFIAKDSLDIVILNISTSDTEYLELIETASNSGIFRGVLPLDSGPLSSNNGILTGFNDQTADVHYEDIYDSSDTAADEFLIKESSDSILNTTDNTGFIVKNSYFLGEKIYIRIIDDDNNRDLSAIENIAVTLNVQTTGDSETLYINETEISSGIFFYSLGILSQKTAAIAGDGILQTANSDTVTVSYSDRYHNDDNSIAYAFISQANSRIKSLHFHNDLSCDTFSGNNTVSLTQSVIQWTQTPAFAEDFIISGIIEGVLHLSGDGMVGKLIVEKILTSGDTQVIGISDDFTLTSMSDIYMVSLFPAVSTISAGERVLVKLVFTGGVPTTYFDSRISDSRIEIPTVTYVNVESAMSYKEDFATDPAGTSANLDFYPGQTIWVRAAVSDPFGSYDIMDSTGARIISPSLTVDTNMIMVSDDGISLKKFQYPVPAVTPGNYSINIMGVESNLVTDSSSFTISVSTSVSQVSFTDEFGIDKGNYIPGDTIYITLEDEDSNLAPSSSDSEVMTLLNLTSADTESIVGWELSPGIFKFSIISALTPVSVGDGILQGDPGDVIYVQYSDPWDSGDISSDTAVFILSSASSLDIENSNNVSQAIFKVGQKFYIRGDDLDENVDDLILDDIQITAESLIGGDSETFVLDETGMATGIFLSALNEFTAAASAVGDGVMTVSSPDSVVFSYSDRDDPSDTSSVIIAISSTVLGTLEMDSALYLEGNTINISLFDPDLNSDINTAESVDVYISGGTGDTEKVTLNSLGINSDTFTGSISVIEDRTPSIYTVYDAIFHASGDGYSDTITCSYDDLSVPGQSHQLIYSYSTFQGVPLYEIEKEQKYDIRAQGLDQEYTVYFRNFSTTKGSGCDINDLLATGLAFNSATDGGALSGNTVTWVIGEIVPSIGQDSVTLIVDVQFSLSDGDTVSNYAVIDDGTNYETSNITVFTAGYFPYLEIIDINDDPDPVNAGESISYTITAENCGNTPAVTFIGEFSVPDLTSWVSGGTLAGNTVSFPIASLNVGDTVSMNYIVEVSTSVSNGTILTQHSRVTASNVLEDARDEEDTLVNSQPALSIVKSVDPSMADIGAAVTYTLVVQNIGTDTAYNTVLEDQIPFDTTFSWADSGGVFAAGVCTWALGDILPGEIVTVNFAIIIAVSADYGDVIWNSARGIFDGAGAYTYSNSISFDVNVFPILSLTKSSTETVVAGDTIAFAVILENTGTDTALSMSVYDTVPAGMTFQSSIPAPSSFSGDVYRWNLASLGISDTYLIQIMMTADITIPNSTGLTNRADLVTSYGNDDYDTADYTVLNTASLSLDKSAPSIVECGDTFVYSIAYQSTGADTLTSVVIYDTIPQPLSWVSGGTYDGTGVSFNIGEIEPYSTVNTVSFVVSVPASFTNGYSIANIANGNSFESGDSFSDYTYTVISSTPVLSIEKEVDKLAASQGDPLIYSFVITNTGTDTALSSVISDTISIFLNYLSGADTVTGSLIQIDVGDVLPGETVSESFIVTIDIATPMDTIVYNSAALTAVNSDTVFSDTVATTVGLYQDPALDNLLLPVSIDQDDTATVYVSYSNQGDDISDTFNVTVEFPDYFIPTAPGATVEAGKITYEIPSMAISASDTQSFVIAYSTPASVIETSVLFRAYVTPVGTEKDTVNNTAISSIMLYNDIAAIYILDKNNISRRTLLPPVRFIPASDEEFILTGHTISPNSDGFKDSITLYWEAAEILIDGRDDLGNILADGDYKVVLRITPASGEMREYIETIHIYSAPEDLISSIKLYPNPSYGADQMIFSYIPNYDCSVKITIYGVAGNKINSYFSEDSTKEQMIWDLTNSSGEKVASGIYFIIIRAEYEGKRELFGPFKAAVIK